MLSGDAALQLRPELLSEVREEAAQDPRHQDAAEDVARSPTDRRELQRVIFQLHDVAVFLAQRPVADQGSQGEVQDLGQILDRFRMRMRVSRTFQRPDDGLCLVGKGAGYEAVFLMGSDDVRGSCERVEMGRWRGR